MKYVIGKGLEHYGAGVARKVTQQVEVFSALGMKCELYVLPFYSSGAGQFAKILRRFPFVNLHKHWRLSDFLNEDCLYIRRFGGWDGYAISFFERLKEKNPSIKIVYELPVYPYDDEISKLWKTRPLFWKDKWNRRYLCRFVDRIATLTDDREIFGIPTLKIGNGLHVDKIRPRKIVSGSEIHAIAVSNCEWWHGYDRFIEGMREYYSGNHEQRLIFHLVGNGSEFSHYKELVHNYGLDDYVVLHGHKSGEELDEIYDRCNLGVASLGCYRKGLNETQELKSREYTAKGLPFVTSVIISDIPLEDKSGIYLKVPNDDTPIDMRSVLEFYNHIYANDAESVNKRIRQYAKDHFSMEEAMKEVIAFFKEET